jgi:hypothetical protein
MRNPVSRLLFATILREALLTQDKSPQDVEHVQLTAGRLFRMFEY